MTFFGDMHKLLHTAFMSYISHPYLKYPVDEEAVAHDVQLRTLLKATKVWPDDELVLEEFCFPAAGVRADLVVTGEALTGFEIKAGGDRMSRLAIQAQAYSAVCGFANAVTVPDHVNDIAHTVPSWWGVWVASGFRSDLAIRCVRRSKPNPGRNAVRLAQILWREEATSKLKELGLSKGTASATRAALAQKVANALGIDEIDRYVQTCLRKRPKAEARRSLLTATLKPMKEWKQLTREQWEGYVLGGRR